MDQSMLPGAPHRVFLRCCNRIAGALPVLLCSSLATASPTAEDFKPCERIESAIPACREAPTSEDCRREALRAADACRESVAESYRPDPDRRKAQEFAEDARKEKERREGRAPSAGQQPE